MYLTSWIIGVIFGYAFYLIFIGERCRLIRARRAGKSAGVSAKMGKRDVYGRAL